MHYRSRQMAARAPYHRPMRAAAVLHGSSVRARTMDGVPTLALTCTAPRDAIWRINADVRPGSCGVWTPHLRAHNGPRFSCPAPFSASPVFAPSLKSMRVSVIVHAAAVRAPPGTGRLAVPIRTQLVAVLTVATMRVNVYA